MANKNITGVSFSIVFLLACATGMLLSASLLVSSLALIVIFLFLISFLRHELFFFFGICSAGFYNIAVIHSGAMDIRPFQIVWCLFFLTLILKMLTKRRGPFSRSPILWPLLLLVLANFLSVFGSRDPLVSVRETVQTLYFVLVFMCIVVFVNSNSRLEKSIKTLTLVTGVLIFFGILETVIGIAPFPQIEAALTGGSLELSLCRLGPSAISIGKEIFNKRASSLFLGPVGTANYLLFSLPLMLGLLSIHRMRKRRILLIIFIMGIGLLLLTFARAGWGAFVFVLIVYLLLQKQGKHIGIVLLSAFALVIVTVSPFKTRIESLMNPFTDPSIRGHLALYMSAVKLFLTSPTLGIGAGMFSSSLKSISYVMRTYQVPWLTSGDTHNLFLQTLSETGLIGLASLLYFFYVFYKRMAKALRLKNLGDYRNIVIGFLLSSLGGLLMNLTMNGFRFETFWVFYGLAYASAEIALRRSSETGNSELHYATGDK